MPRSDSSAPRKKLPPPTTTATWVPSRTTSAICRAIELDDDRIDADLPAAEHLAGQLEHAPAGRPAAAGMLVSHRRSLSLGVRSDLDRARSALDGRRSGRADLEVREPGDRHTGLVEHRP